MKLQKTTIILVILALSLGGGVYFYEIKSQQQQGLKNQQVKIFALSEDDIQSVTIETENNEKVLQFERTNNNLTPWQMKQPEDTTASDAAISFLLNLLAEGNIDKSFTIKAQQKEEYGLIPPFAKIKIKLKNQSTQELILGKTSFDETQIYAQINPGISDEQNRILLLPITFKYAVERDFQEWKQETPLTEKDVPESQELPNHEDKKDVPESQELLNNKQE